MEQESPFESVPGWIVFLRGAIGYAVLEAIAIAFLVMGNTPGRLIGLGLLALCVFIGVRVRRGHWRSFLRF